MSGNLPGCSSIMANQILEFSERQVVRTPLGESLVEPVNLTMEHIERWPLQSQVSRLKHRPAGSPQLPRIISYKRCSSREVSYNCVRRRYRLLPLFKEMIDAVQSG